ncbi:hypothetical protein [Mycobacterium sp. DL99]|uniref:SMP-30/gluconolactonase/LRE family protein n=1 Tax=Mycobacterium sp. DL99 TaxID=2528957 RepID=UPI001080D90B|nr:hypothetical protein [Mycobacterium sp. DL99]
MPGWVWACAVDGSAPERIVEDDPVFINGLAFTGDERSLLVTSTLTSQLLSYAAPSWARAQPVHTFDNDAIDAAGNRCASIDLPPGSLPTDVCIGGPGLDELYVTAAHGQSLLHVRFDDDDPHHPTSVPI